AILSWACAVRARASPSPAATNPPQSASCVQRRVVTIRIPLALGAVPSARLRALFCKTNVSHELGQFIPREDLTLHYKRHQKRSQKTYHSESNSLSVGRNFRKRQSNRTPRAAVLPAF